MTPVIRQSSSISKVEVCKGKVMFFHDLHNQGGKAPSQCLRKYEKSSAPRVGESLRIIFSSPNNSTAFCLT